MKASRAPGPLSYPQRAPPARPLVGKTNVDCKRIQKKGITNGDGGRLTKYIDFEEIPDLDNGWGKINVDAESKINGNAPPSVLISPRKIDSAYHIKTVHHNYHNYEVTENLDKISLNDVESDGYHSGRSRMPLSADQQFMGQNNLNVTKCGRTAHGHATAPAESTRLIATSVDTNCKYSDRHDTSKIPYDASLNDNNENSDDDESFDYVPQYQSPPKKITSKLSNLVKIGTDSLPMESSHKSCAADKLPPPLPYDLSNPVGNKELTEEEKLYYSKQPRQVEFKPYTISQYRLIRPKEYVEISKMKPDLNTDDLVAKRRNVERVKEFSKQLRAFNQEVIMQQPKKPSSGEENGISLSKFKQESSRHRALEFAKNIPKPKVNSVSVLDESCHCKDKNDGSLYMDEEAIDAARLEELEQKHQQNKARMDAIRRSLAL